MRSERGIEASVVLVDTGHVKGIQIQMIRRASRLQKCHFFAVKPYPNEAELRQCWLFRVY